LDFIEGGMDAADVNERKSWWPIIGVILLALSLRVWIVVRSEVAARDSIGFIKSALRYETEPFAKVLRESEQPPGYPVAVMVASWPVRLVAGDITPRAMALSAQIASAFFGTLLVLPMIGLGTELFNRRFGIIAAVLFQALPAWVKLTADGLSESTFLFFTVTGLWAAARAFRTNQPIWFGICGLASGAAYFTRPEGAELIPVVLIVLTGMSLLRQLSWRRTMIHAVVLVAGFSVFFGPFFAITGRITNKPTGRFLLGDPTAEKSYFTVGAAPTTTAPLLAVWWQGAQDKHKNRLIWAAESLVTELALASRQIGLALSILGLCFWHQRVRNRPGGAVLMILSALHALLLIRMTSSIGYLSERHTALILVAGVYPATLGLLIVVEKAARLQWRGQGFTTVPLLVIFAVGAVATGLPSLRKPLHYNRAGHRKAGEWLAEHAPPGTGICDPFCWATYYAGRDFLTGLEKDPPDQFVILEASNNQHSRLPLMPEAKAKAAAGELVYSWPDTPNSKTTQVQVYRWRRPAQTTTSTANPPSPPSAAGASNRTATASR
jgi:4-amino-4-deoxy-L-arabinose transferase-like glycosyltransferase